MLGQKGYARATIKEVAREAGVSRGLLHYYFASKEEMLTRVMRETVETTALLAEGIFRQSRSAPELARGLVAAMQAFVRSEPHFSSIFFESWGLARHSQRVNQDLRELYRHFVQAVQRGLEDAADRGVIPVSDDSEATAMVLTAIIDGMSLQIMVTPGPFERPGVWDAIEKAVLRVLSPGA